MQYAINESSYKDNEFAVSANNTKWVFTDIDERDVMFVSQKFGLSYMVAKILLSRGITGDNIYDFLNPTIKSLLPNPLRLLDMEKGVQRVVDAILRKEKIAIFGDYDVDGATSSALLSRFFKEVGAEHIVYIPDRLTEGYGPNVNAMRKLAGQQATVCITVDCGTLAFEPLEAAHKVGMDVIVVDHHISAETLPLCYAIINPNRLDESFPCKNIAAVGITFLLVVAINASLRDMGFYHGKKTPDLMQLLDLVALGTVCDVMPLVGVNRAFVAQGLKILRNANNIGFKVLMDVARVDEELSAYHLGFVLGPRINAGGRVGKSDLGSLLLATDDEELAVNAAFALDGFNKERQAMEQFAFEEAILQVEEESNEKIKNAPIIFVKSYNWHEGIIGIVAGRLKEIYHKPVAVITIKDGIGKASARSISGVDFGAAIIAANSQDILISGGGHAMAAGFSIKEENIPALFAFLCNRFKNDYDNNSQKTLYIDAIMSAKGVTVDLIKELKVLEPYGVANQQPRFVLDNICIVKFDIMKQKHISCIIADRQGVGGGGSVRAVAFSVVGTRLGDALISAASLGKKLSLAGRLNLNIWQGMERPQFLIDDVITY